MREHLAALVRASPTPQAARNVAREYLQTRILAALQHGGTMISLAFHGGTLLRLVYGLPRYSEGLDFALERERERYDLRALLAGLRTRLQHEGYAVDLRLSDQWVVHSAFVRFPGLPHALGLSPHRGAVLSVKVEVDTNPPAGARLATSIVRRHTTLHLQHHDPASLLAGKLHAILQRPYGKGRDLYDLLWYLSDPGWPAPNLELLNNALRQTGWERGPLDEGSWRDYVRERVLSLRWDLLIDDVQPFLADEEDLRLLTADNVLAVLARPRPA